MTQLDGRRWWVLVVMCCSLLVISVDNTILNVALPTLARELSASSSQLQWFVDAYVLAFAGLLLTAGSIGDRYGRKLWLLIGLVIFSVGSLGAALSDSSERLIAARALMGIGGAFIMPSTLSIITNVFPERERGRAIGIWTGAFGLGIAIGPLAGGWLLEYFSWGSVFLVNLPIVVTAIVATLLIVRESKDSQALPLDPVGAVLSVVGISALLYGIIEVPSYGWGDGGIIVAFSAAAIFLIAFGIWEMRVKHPMLDISLFRNPRFSGASGAITLVSFALFGTIFSLTQYLQLVQGYATLDAGLRILPVALGLIIGSGLSTRFAERIGLKYTVAGGLAIVACGLTVMSLLKTDSGYELVATALIVMGLGMGTAMAPATNSIMGSLPLDKAGVGSATNDTTRQIGGALGVAILGSVLSSVYHDKMSSVGAGLPQQAVDALRDSISKATGVAARVGGPTGQSILVTAREAFVQAMNQTVLVAAGVALAGALVALLILPVRVYKTEPKATPELALQD